MGSIYQNLGNFAFNNIYIVCYIKNTSFPHKMFPSKRYTRLYCGVYIMLNRLLFSLYLYRLNSFSQIQTLLIIS